MIQKNEPRGLIITFENGHKDGIVKCEFDDTNYIIYKMPRNVIRDFSRTSPLKNWGIYFLIGNSNSGDNIFYVGQATIRKNENGILERLNEHSKNEKKDYYTEAIIITSEGRNFNEASLKYLENRFYKIAKESKRYIIDNGQEPVNGNLTNYEKVKLDKLIEDVKLVVGLFGYDMFDPKDFSNNKQNDYLTLYLHHKDGTAICMRTETEFIVQSGSCIAMDDRPSLPKHIKQIRNNAIKKGDIVDGKLMESYPFKSPSAAATFVRGTSLNGRDNWVDSEGTPLKVLEENNSEGPSI